ncbi:hypothetical protein Tco_1323716, partial [Tanacetum coccineum]
MSHHLQIFVKSIRNGVVRPLTNCGSTLHQCENANSSQTIRTYLKIRVGQGFCYSFDVVFIGNERVVVMRNSPAIEYDDTESWANVDDFL